MNLPTSTVAFLISHTQHNSQSVLVKISQITKERILKAAREKEIVTYKGAAVRIAADFSK